MICDRSPLTSDGCTNVVISSNCDFGVAGALGRLMLCRMSEFVPPENGREGTGVGRVGGGNREREGTGLVRGGNRGRGS